MPIKNNTKKNNRFFFFLLLLLLFATWNLLMKIVFIYLLLQSILCWLKYADHFDGRFMSIGQPKEALLYPNGTAEYPVRYSNNLSPSRKPGLNNSPYGNAPQRSKWNLGSLQLPDGTRVRTRLSRKVRKKLEKFLWLYTQCPVIYRWKDLGSRYWPRWIKQGRCHANQSCSFPPGMTCRASEEREVVILRWHCQYWDPPRFCKWIPLHYPIVRQCSCGCSAVSKTVNWIIFFFQFFIIYLNVSLFSFTFSIHVFCFLYFFLQ